jgi:hypothetical protein
MCSADNAHANDLSISVIVDIMLGENAFNPDIMASHSSESSHGIGKDSNEPGLLRNELNQAYLSVYESKPRKSTHHFGSGVAEQLRTKMAIRQLPTDKRSRPRQCLTEIKHENDRKKRSIWS